MPIELDKNENGTYGRDKNQFTTKKENYENSNLFFIITHTESNPEPSKVGVRDITFLTFASKELGHIRSFFTDDGRFDRVEVFFSTHNDKKPLILGIFSGTHRYYKLSYLKNQFGNILTKHWFGENQLLDKLIAENNKLNNVITYRLEKRDNTNYDGITISKENHPSFDKYKHTPKSSENTPAYVLYNGKTLTLTGQSSFKGSATKLTDIQKKCYTDVTVFFYKSVKGTRAPELPIFLVLQEKTTGTGDGTGNTYCLQRTDQSGIKWKQITDPNLDDVITFLIEQRPKTTESYNGSIDVKPQEHPSFNVYEHTPKTPHNDKKAYLLYVFQFIELEKKTETTITLKLENLQLHKCCKVTVYFFKAERNNFNATIPIYLKLQENGSTKYCLQRTDSYAIKWKQIKDPNLSNTITYLLDHKPERGSSYNNGSVTVSKGEHVSFDVYTHKPQDENKLGLLLYNSSLIILDNTKLPGGVDKLDKLEFKNYCEISLYYFKLSNNGSHEIPTYIELKIKETGDESSKSYYLQRYSQSPIHWTQIKNPELEKVITFLLDKTLTDTTHKYNGDSVTITNEPHSSFKVIKHAPSSGHDKKKGILRYNDHDLVLVSNEQLGTEVDKIKDFNGHVYCQVSLFYYKETRENTLPVFLELKIKGTTSGENQQDCTISSDSKCYLFRRVDEQGVKWTQIDYQDLRNTVTYQLECKECKKGEYEKSVNVTKGSEGSFDKYTHIPTKPTKLALFLYNWETLTLQPNDGFSGTKLDKLHGNKYCKVCVYFSKSYDRDQPPLFLELFEHTTSDTSSSFENCQCPDGTTGNCKCYWLQRVDLEGHHWKQITKPGLGEQNAQEIVNQVRTNDKNSMMVSLTEKAAYNIRTIKHYETNGVGRLQEPVRQIELDSRTLSSSDYRYRSHNFVQSVVYSGLKISNLRTFIGNIEIKFFNVGGIKKQILSYSLGSITDKLYVYFVTGDEVPLLIYYNKWFSSTKQDYFKKWTEISTMSGHQPTHGDSNDQIKRKLEEINKNFNEILLHETAEKGYGISPPPNGKTPSGFDTKRVTVKQEPVKPPSQKFGKVTHRTVNNSSIGLIKFEDHTLKDDKSKNLSEQVLSDTSFKNATVTTVTAYYHKNDSDYSKPLLLGFAKSSGSRTEVFYERQGVSDTSQWKKISDSGDLRELRSDDGIAKRVDEIHYTIGKSIVIQVDQQTRQGSGTGNSTYPAKLVDNKVAVSGPTPAVGGQSITVTKNDCNTRAPPTGYTCFKHTIPPEIGGTDSHYISGLKLYVCEKYLETHSGSSSSHKLPIYFDTSKTEVKVYFYQHGTSGTSSNTPLDKVPLLVEYNGRHYKPQTRDVYFTKWVQTEIPTGDGRGDGEEARGDLAGLPQIGNVLEDINKELNTIQLEQTGDTSTGGNKYGIKAPSPQTGTCGTGTGSKTPVKEFCERVTVTRNGDGAGHYLKVTHTTNNKGPVGKFTYGGQPIEGIKLDSSTGCNKVEVYYKVGDDEYKNPLLIHISSQTTESGRTCTGKWFHRKGVKLTEWNDAEIRSSDASSIKAELEKIQIKLSNYLDLDISRQKQYSVYVQKGSEESGKKQVGKISVTPEYGHDQYKVEHYQRYQHYLSSYYSTYKKQIQEQLQLESQGNDLTLQVSIYLVSIYIDILGTSEEKLDNPLIYGPTEASRADPNHVLVYFYDPETYSSVTDTVPLLFKYGERYFVPNSKKEYFTTWKEVKITGGDQKASIKKQLDEINGKLNEIDLSNKAIGTGDDPNYGIPDPGGGGTLTPGFDTKRIKVEKKTDQGTGSNKYITISHTTTNGYNIGSITGLGTGCEFDNKHTVKLARESHKHNQAVAVYAGAGASVTGQAPRLVLIAESKRGLGTSTQSSTVHGYYDLTNGGQGVRDCNSARTIQFKKVTPTFTVDDLTNRGKMTGNEQLVTILTKLGIVKKEVQQAQLQAASSDSARDGDARGGSSDGVDSGAPGQGAPGQTGEQGDRGIKGQPAASPGPTEQSTVSSGHTTHTNGTQSQEHTNHDGGGNGMRPNGGEASPQGKNGEDGPQGQQADSTGGFDEIIKQAGEFFKKPEGYGSASAVGGVGLMGGVGAVVYKKCVESWTTNPSEISNRRGTSSYIAI